VYRTRVWFVAPFSSHPRPPEDRENAPCEEEVFAASLLLLLSANEKRAQRTDLYYSSRGLAPPRAEKALFEQSPPTQRQRVVVRHATCTGVIALTLLTLLLSVSFVVYAIITSNELSEIQSDLKALKNQQPLMPPPPALGTAQQQQQQPRLNPPPSQPPRKMGVLAPPQPPRTEQQPPSPPPPAPTQQKTPQLHSIQFETPIGEGESVRVPLTDENPGLAGVSAAQLVVECDFGRATTKPTHDQVSLRTVGTHLIVQAPGTAFRGRRCVVSWTK
jgi:hypothetical protein